MVKGHIGILLLAETIFRTWFWKLDYLYNLLLFQTVIVKHRSVRWWFLAAFLGGLRRCLHSWPSSAALRNKNFVRSRNFDYIVLQMNNSRRHLVNLSLMSPLPDVEVVKTKKMDIVQMSRPSTNGVEELPASISGSSFNKCFGDPYYDCSSPAFFREERLPSRSWRVTGYAPGPCYLLMA